MRYGGGAFLPVRLVVGTSEQGVERRVSGRVGLVVGTFIIQDADGTPTAFHADLKGDYDVMKLPTIASGIDASGARFERLLLEAGIHAEADDVMQSLQFLRDTAILSANTPAQALQWYK